MRNAYSIVFILLALFLISANAKSQELWQGAEINMRVEGVLELFPNAVSIPNGGCLGAPKWEKRKCEKVKIPTYEIFGKNFEVRFYFFENNLIRVHLQLPRKEIIRGAEAVELPFFFEKAVSSLRVKYGKEDEYEVRQEESECEGYCITRRAYWLLDSREIEAWVAYNDTMPDMLLLQVSYDGEIVLEKEKF